MSELPKTAVTSNLLLLSDKELLAAALVAGILFGIGHGIGRERQRRFLEKHTVIISK